MKILTERTTLSPIELSDLKAIHTLHSLPETDEFNTLGIPKNIKETQSVIEPWILENHLPEVKNYTFKIERNSDGQFISLFGLKFSNKKYNKAEVWYKLHSDYWRQGLATEVLAAVIDFGFNTLHLHRIQAGCAVDNYGSIKVLEKVGMIREGRGRQVLPLVSGWSDNFEYSILETDSRTFG